MLLLISDIKMDLLGFPSSHQTLEKVSEFVILTSSESIVSFPLDFFLG